MQPAARKPYLFGIHARPPNELVWVYRALPFVIVILLYQIVSMNYLADNPGGKLFPSFQMMGEAIWNQAFTLDTRTGVYPLWADTLASLERVVVGLSVAAAVGLLLGVNMALFPGMRYMLLPFITSLSNIPPLALLPILLVFLGIGDFAKMSLIFFGTVFYIARDLYNATMEVPEELRVKAATLGATQLALVYRIVLPMVMPRLIEAVRQSLGPAWLFLISGEFVAATEGLGYRIALLRRYLDMATIIPYVVWITLLAFVFDRLLALATSYFYRWKK